MEFRNLIKVTFCLVCCFCFGLYHARVVWSDHDLLRSQKENLSSFQKILFMLRDGINRDDPPNRNLSVGLCPNKFNIESKSLKKNCQTPQWQVGIWKRKANLITLGCNVAKPGSPNNGTESPNHTHSPDHLAGPIGTLNILITEKLNLLKFNI